MDTMVTWRAAGTAGRGLAASVVCGLVERMHQVVESSAAMDTLHLDLSGNGPLLSAAVIGGLLGVTRWGALLMSVAVSGVAIIGEAQATGPAACLAVLLGLLLSGVVDRTAGAVLERVVTALVGWWPRADVDACWSGLPASSSVVRRVAGNLGRRICSDLRNLVSLRLNSSHVRST